MTREVLLLSIRPEHATKIFEGTKKVELRRVRPSLSSGDWVLVYVSTPVQALMGAFEVDKVIEAEPEDLWKLVHRYAGITKEQFDSYYLGTTKAYGIFLRGTRPLPAPISLISLRQLVSDFHPPQSYLYISQNQANTLNEASQQMLRRELLQKMPSSNIRAVSQSLQGR